MILNIGAGASGQGDKMIDRVNFPGVTEIIDVAVNPLPYANGMFDEVRAQQSIEHIPTQIYWYRENIVGMILEFMGIKTERFKGKFHSRYPRIELFKEIYRVLKPGGILNASVPNLDNVGWAQDPTHVDVPVPLKQFTYFCGQYGGNDPGKEAYDSYGIDFAFNFVNAFNTGAILTVILRKPNT